MKLILDGKDYGTVGEKTNYRTVHGEDVHVGDLVKTTCFNGHISVVEPVVKSQICYDKTKVFVMGVELMCDDVAGTIEGNKILEIVKPYTALVPGDKVGKQNIEVVGEQEETEEETCDDVAGTIEGNKILEIVKPYTALVPGDKVGKQNIEVVGEQEETEEETEEETKELPGVDIAEVFVFGILDKAIKDLKDSDKDYHGLSFIKTLLQGVMK